MRAFNLFGILLLGFCAVPCLAQTVKHTPDSTVTIKENGDTLIEYHRHLVEIRSPFPQQNKERRLLVSEEERVRREEEHAAEQEALLAKMREQTLAYKQLRTGNDRTSYDVGAIPLQEGVSPFGGRTYSVPVPTAAGLKHVPEISITYNSQADEGFVGYGWDIQGIRTIELINKNAYYHEAPKAADVYVQSNPVFALDGIPLVTNDDSATSGSYPLVTAQGHILASPRTGSYGYIVGFDVLFPDGSQGTFGFTSGPARHFPTYPIVESRDILGNVISYTYLQSPVPTGGLYQPYKICYGNDTAGGYSAEIEFEYEDATDYAKRYYAGVVREHRKRLVAIESRDRDSVLCRYALNYTQKDGVHLLSRVECSNGNGSSLPPLDFSYGNSGNQNSNATEWVYEEDSLSMSTAYLNTVPVCRRGKYLSDNYNDGVLLYPKFKTYGVTESVHIPFVGWRYKFGNSHGSVSFLFVSSLKDDPYIYGELSSGDGFQTVEVVDVDGDGVDEIVRVNLAGTSGSKSIIGITIYKCDSTGTPQQTDYFTVQLNGTITSGSYVSPYHYSFNWGDFNGDGKAELLTVAYDKNNDKNPYYDQNCYTALIDLDAKCVLSDEVLFSFPFSRENCLVICDLDGDSRSELCYATDSGFDVYRRQSSGSFAKEKTYTVLNASILSSETQPYYITDLNGDGYVDFIQAPAVSGASAIWEAYLFNGHTFTNKSISIRPRDGSESFMFMDLNQDGLSDMICLSGTGLTSYRNIDGASFGSYQQSPCHISNAAGIVPANIVNKNKTSAFIKVDGWYLRLYGYTSIAPEQRALTIATDSFGNAYYNVYTYLPKISGAWTDSSYSPTVSAGYAKRVLPLHVLSSESKYEGDSSFPYRFFQHRYYDSVVHNLGLGFCGFHVTKSFQIHYFLVGNIMRSATRGSETTYCDPEKRGVVTRIERRLGADSNSSPYNIATNTWDNHSTTYGKLSPRLQYSILVDSLTLVRTNTEYAYDSYDYPVLTYVIRTAPGMAQQRQLFTWSYSHSVSASRYLLGSVLQENLRTDLDGVFTRSWKEKSIYQLDSLKRPINRKDYRGVSIGSPSLFQYELQDSTLLVSETRWTYDAFGNIVSERSAPYNSTEFLGDSLVYDSTGRFLLSRTDALGHMTTYSGYNKFGSPAAVTDYRGRAKTFLYDSWGNLLQTNYADGSVETVSREWTNGAWSTGTYGSMGSSIYAVTTSCTGKPSRIVHYDALGREVHSGDQRFDGQWRWTDRQYDLDGRLSKVSLPYKTETASATTPAASLWNTYSYDSYDRVTSIAEASGRTTTWSYNGTSTTTLKDGITSTSTTDAAGNVISVTDAGGTIVYALRDDGQPSSVTAPGDVVTTFTYDGYGRRVGMDDPSVGTRSYSYTWNADGSSQTTQSGPNGTITTSKDKYGRTTSIARAGEFTTTYSYDTYGRLTGEVSTNGTSTTYAYDTLNRVASIREDIPDGKWLKRDYTYGAGSNIAAVLYTSQADTLTTELYSYAYGHNKGILLPDSTVVFRLNFENDFGQPTWIKTGAVSRQYGFNAYGLPTLRKMIVGAGGPITTLQDFSYVFNEATGNLTSRSDDENGTDETLEYDSLGRLVQASTSGGGSSTSSYFSFEDNGNFTYRSGFGFIDYDDPDDPYLATSFTNPAYITTLLPKQTVAYNSYDRPASIFQNGITATLTYNRAEDRVKMAVVDSTGTVPATLLTRYYIGGRYEIDIAPAGSGGGGTSTTERFYLGGDAYSAPMVLVRSGGSGAWTAYNIGRDYLGSITHIITASGSPVAEYSYEPWGRQRNPSTLIVYAAGSEPALFLGRGYTGHEYLPWFGLYNMNARLYDPLVGRFLAPDPFVQAPDFTQNYNRYSYCLNNPLKYNDESGEHPLAVALFVVGCVSVIYGLGNVAAHAIRGEDLGQGNWAKYYASGFVSGFISTLACPYWYLVSSAIGPGNMAGFYYRMILANPKIMYPYLTVLNFVTSAYNGIANGNDKWFNNFAKTALGYFYLDENKTFFGEIWEGISRNIWEGRQETLGYAYSSIRNAWADRVDLWGGSTFSTNITTNKWDGVTLGSFININVDNDDINSFRSFDDYIHSNNYDADYLYLHEFGHTVQSKIWGPAYLPVPGLLSLWNCRDFWDKNIIDHDNFWTEVWANTYSKKYHSEHYPGFAFPTMLPVKY